MTIDPFIVASYTYEGPIERVDDRTCPLCNAAAAKKCSKTNAEHGTDPHSCATCAMAKAGYCPNHCGWKRALAGAPSPLVEFVQASIGGNDDCANVSLRIVLQDNGTTDEDTHRGIEEHLFVRIW